MISVKKHYVSLVNLKETLDALERIDRLIACYGVANTVHMGNACVRFDYTSTTGIVDIQFDREIITAALLAQREKLVSHLADLGLNYDKKAS